MAQAKRGPDLSWASEQPLHSAVVVFDPAGGATRRVAEALGRGIAGEAVATEILSVPEALQRPLDTFDLVVLGSPSSFHAPTPAIEDLLKALKRLPRLKNHYGFGFDLRHRHHPAGAARHIESVLYDLGLRVSVPPESATLEPPAPGGGDRLEPGTEERFEALGHYLVRAIRGEVDPSTF